MANDHEIGRLVAVDTAEVTVELNRELKALARSTYEGTLEVGRINSYIIIPVGAHRIVAMVTRVFLTEENELKADKTMVTLPSSRRLMKATMIGTIDEGRFRQGISLFPVLDTPILITTKEDLNSIFGRKAELEKPTPEEPGFCIPIGRSTVFPDYEIKIDPDAFFGKHAAIIGSTGSGKSCSIATIIQSVIEQTAVKQTRFIILDPNGEYRAAFQKANVENNWVDAHPKFKSLYIPTDPAEPERLTIPYWFMDSEDFIRLFRASPGAQQPVLLHALSLARDSKVGSKHLPSPETSTAFGFSSSDCPRFFGKLEFRKKYLENAILWSEEFSSQRSSSQVRNHSSTMLMRICRLLEDSRFDCLFGTTHNEWPSIVHSLATFIRDLLGVENFSTEKLSNTQKCPNGQLPFYDRQRRGASRSNVVIIDLSLLASEVLENVTALIGRLIHEFLRRLTDQKMSGISRGEYPVVLVLEEAHNYIREGIKTEEDSISKLVFERIAREGRKYGLGLVVASQRPSRLSKTVLSQCNSFIVHRLQNPEDLRYFREIVPGIYGQMLEQLPVLAPRSALVLGECVQAPALTEMREANPIPNSKNPLFYKSWTEKEKLPDFEAVCEKWEGKQSARPAPDDQSVAGSGGAGRE